MSKPVERGAKPQVYTFNFPKTLLPILRLYHINRKIEVHHDFPPGNTRVKIAKHARPSPPLNKLQRATVAPSQTAACSARLRFRRA
jgi:hypothetical protein